MKEGTKAVWITISICIGLCIIGRIALTANSDLSDHFIAVADVQDGYIDMTLGPGDPNDPNRVEFEDKYAWSAEDAAGMETNWSIETYSDITVTTNKGTVSISVLGLADCNDVEISRFADFLQIVTVPGGLFSYDPEVYGILVDRLISPKLIKSDPNDPNRIEIKDDWYSKAVIWDTNESFYGAIWVPPIYLCPKHGELESCLSFYVNEGDSTDYCALCLREVIDKAGVHQVVLK